MPETELQEGDSAPNFSLPAGDGRTIALKDFRGKQAVVLYFYPKDDTPGCTKEACSFRDERAKFDRLGAAVLGVSLDPVASHQKFSKKYDLNFPLLADEEMAVSKAYGVYKLKTNYGKTYWGIERSTFVIDKQGKIQKIFRKVKVDGHSDEVLEALKG